MSRETKEESGIAKGARRATEAGPDFRSRGKGRWSARRKVTVVLELLRGEDLEAMSRQYGVTAAALTPLAGGVPAGRRGRLEEPDRGCG